MFEYLALWHCRPFRAVSSSEIEKARHYDVLLARQYQYLLPTRIIHAEWVGNPEEGTTRYLQLLSVGNWYYYHPGASKISPWLTKPYDEDEWTRLLPSSAHTYFYYHMNPYNGVFTAYQLINTQAIERVTGNVWRCSAMNHERLTFSVPILSYYGKAVWFLDGSRVDLE